MNLTDNVCLEHPQFRLDSILFIQCQIVRQHLIDFLGARVSQYITLTRDWNLIYSLILPCFFCILQKLLHSFDIHLLVNLLKHIITLFQSVEDRYFDQRELDGRYLLIQTCEASKIDVLQEWNHTSCSKFSSCPSVFNNKLCWYLRWRKAMIARSFWPAARWDLAIACSRSRITWI